MRSEHVGSAGMSTVLHRLHPLSKLFVLALVCVTAFVFEPWFVPAALAVALLFLHAPREVGTRRLGAVLKLFPLFGAIIVLANVFLVSRAGPWWEHAGLGLVQTMRVFVLIAGANLFLAVTDPVDSSDAVLRAAGPLGRVGVPVGELSLMVMLVSSFVPLMADEARRLALAQAARCGFPRRGLGAVTAAVPLFVPLVIGIFRRTDEIEAALQARSFRIGAPRSVGAHVSAGRTDFFVCAASALLFLAGLYAQH